MPRARHLGNSEVPEFDCFRLREEDILRLQVAMQNLAVVDMFERKRRLQEPGNRREGRAGGGMELQKKRGSRGPQFVTTKRYAFFFSMKALETITFGAG